MLRTLRQAIRYFLRRSRLEDDIRREVGFHLQAEIDQRVAQGVPLAEARRTALRDFGGVDRTTEELRDVRGVNVWEQLRQDLRFGVRTLRHSPGYTFTAMLILALGIGANTAIFSVIDGVLLKPLPFPESDRLVLIQQSAPLSNITATGVAIPELQDYRQRLQSVRDLVEYHRMNFTLLKQGEPDRVTTGVVSSNFFDVLGVKPILGRTFNDEDEKLGADAVLLLSNEYWLSKFGGDQNVVGRVLEMNNRPHTVIGVLPSFPQYPQPNDLYMPPSACPFRAQAQRTLPQGHRTFPMNAIGRLVPGATTVQASSEIAGIASSFAVQHANNYQRARGFTGRASTVQDQLVVGARPMLWALAGTTMLVLLITCANVANLALARTVRRSREMAVRTALGASRWRLFRQLITESVIVAAGGAAAGMFLAWASLGMLTSFVGRFTPWTAQIEMDGGVLVFTAVTAMLTGLVFGTIPAMAARRGVVDAVRDGGAQAGEGRGRHRMRSGLVVAQVAVAFVLTVCAALLLESLQRLSSVELGYDTRQVMSANISGNFSKFQDAVQSRELQKQVLAKLRATPGVKAAAVTNVVPLSNIQPGQTPITLEGMTSESTSLLVDPNTAGDGYFESIGVAMLAGRNFAESDTETAAPVAVVNASMARMWGGSTSPLGRRFKVALTPPPGQPEPQWLTVIGIVPDFYLYGGETGMQPQYYVPFVQTNGGGGLVIVRTDGDPAVLPGLIKAAVHSVDAELPVEDIATLEQLKTGRLSSPALTAALLSTFAGIALLITLAGIAGVIGTSVSQRTREFGLRMALGASRMSVIQLVLRQGAVLVTLGIVLGIGGAYAFSRLIQNYLFATAPTDLRAYAVVAVIFFTAALISIAGPARRATTIDPLKALKVE